MEGFPADASFCDERQHRVQIIDAIRAVEALHDANEHFGEITDVIFRLDHERSERTLGCYAKERLAKRPRHHRLHAEAGFADAGLSDDQARSCAAEPAVT